MFICSTVLYFGEEPVGYHCHKEGNVFLLEPAGATQHERPMPAIRVFPAEGGWQVEGVGNSNVREQVAKFAAIQALIDLPEGLSAAS